MYIKVYKRMYFDIGANIGNWSIENSNNCEKIISVEASPNTFQKLINNTEDYLNILPLNYCVCKTEEEFIDFYNCETDTISTINKDWLVSEKSRFYNNHYEYNIIKCKTVTLDKLIKEYGEPELIKIDVEGGEFECLKSLTQKVKNICFEWASETNDINFACLDYLETIGYTEFSLQMEDNYTYRPTTYTTITNIKNDLSKTTPKEELGMIWAK